MAVLKPLSCIRPDPGLAAQIASGPHSAMSREEIRAKVEANPLSYSRIVHPRVLYRSAPSDPDEPYRAAAATLRQWVRERIMIADDSNAFYLYRLECGGHTQTGLVGCASVDEVLRQNIRAHEKIRGSKLKDLARHMMICGAQIGGPMLMAYRNRRELSDWMEAVAGRTPLYRFVSENGILNTIWKIDDPAETAWVERAMAEIPALYIADGHHRVMAAVEICRRERALNPDYTGEEPWNRFACVCFPDDQLQILPYSRMAEDLNGLTEAEFLSRLQDNFLVDGGGAEPVLPAKRGEYAMILARRWYRLTLKEGVRPDRVPDSLDVAVLFHRVLRDILDIDNERTSSRLEFVGGLTQVQALTERGRRKGRVGFLPWPISMEELLAVADAGATMPPKSTWFEPKLCNGLFIHTLGVSL